MPWLIRLGQLALRYGGKALQGLGLIQIGQNVTPSDDDKNKIGGFWVVVGLSLTSALIYFIWKRRKRRR